MKQSDVGDAEVTEAQKRGTIVSPWQVDSVPDKVDEEHAVGKELMIKKKISK